MTDKDTAKYLHDIEEVRLTTETEGWGIIKNWILSQAYMLGDVSNLSKGKTAEEIAISVKANEKARKIAFGWVANIEGEIANARYTKEMVDKMQKEQIVKHFE